MTSPIHSRQTIADGIHSSVSFTFATSASLAASSGYQSYDLYKLALVTGDNTLWILTNNSPTVFMPVAAVPSGSIQLITGSGGTSVQNGTGPTVTVSSSITQLTGAGGIGVSVNAEGYIWTVSGSTPAVQSITGSGGTSVTNSGATWTVSSSIPLVQRLVGQGAVVVTPPVFPSTTWIISGSGGGAGSVFVQGTGSIGVTGDGSVSDPFIVSSSFIQISGTGGTSVTASNGETRFVISSSYPVVESITGSGGTRVSNTGTAWVVSSSVIQIAGTGGITVTHDTTTSSFVISGSSPAVQSITGSGATSVTNSGATWTVSSSLARVFGAGAVTVTHDQTTSSFTVSASVVTVAGAGGITVTNGGGTTYTVSGSAPLVESITGSGGSVVTNTGTKWTVSSSITRIFAGNNITVTHDQTTSSYTISAAAGGGALTSSCTTITGNYVVPTPTTAQTFIFVKTANTNITATLPDPAAAANWPIRFVDIDGSASANSFLVKPASALTTINLLSSSYTNQVNFGSIGFISNDGISWRIW